MKKKLHNKKSPIRSEQPVSKESAISISSLLKSPFDYIIILDANGCILDASQRAAERLRLNKAEIPGKCIWDLLPPELASCRKQYVEAVFQSGKAVRHTDKREDFWQDNILLPVLNSKGETEKAVVLVYDITAHKNAEKALQESEERFRNLVETSHDLIWRCDQNGRFTYLNPAWEKTLGYKPGEMLGRHFGEFKPCGITKQDNSLVKKVMAGADFFGMETTYISKIGQHVDIVFNVRRLQDVDGRTLGSQGSAHDITERKKTEKKLRENESRYRNLFVNSPVPILEANLAGIGEWLQRLKAGGVEDLKAYLQKHPEALRQSENLIHILDINRSACKIFDLKGNDKLNDIVPNIFSENSYDLLKSLLLAIWEERAHFEKEGHGFTSSGEHLDFILQWNTSDEDGALDLARGIFAITDVTESKTLKQRVAQNEKMATLGLLISGISHEINNPNNFIMFNLPILKDYLEELLPIIDDYYSEQPDCKLFGMKYPEFRKDIMELLDNMEHGTNRINNTIARLREFFDPHAKEMFSRVDIHSVIEKSINLCRSQVTAMVKSLEIKLPEKLPEFYTDPHALEHIITNLLINAAYAADKRESRIIITAKPGKSLKEHMIIEVWDNGCGIDKKHMNRIFDPFYSTRSSENGSGLGMFVCLNLAQKLGGHIEIESKPGVETTFRVILPEINQ